jgi:hypothetical protein
MAIILGEQDFMVYGLIIALPVLYGLTCFLFAGNYCNARIKTKIFGGVVASTINSNNGHFFKAVKVSDGEPRQLLFSDRHTNIKPNSALRNPDGIIYEVHESMGETLEPNFINSANGIKDFGFRSFSHAMSFYKDEYFKADYEKLNERIAMSGKSEADKAALEASRREIERKVGLSLLKPQQQDDFTKELAILHRYSNNGRLTGVGLKNLKQSIELKVRSEQQKGLSQQTILTYALGLGMVILAVAFALKLLNKV